MNKSKKLFMALVVVFLALFFYFIFSSKNKVVIYELSTQKSDFDVSVSENRIIDLPEVFPKSYNEIFSKYTNVIAPNGKPIHLLADNSWSDEKIIKARNILEYILTDVPDAKYGADKTSVANSMADRKSALVLFKDWKSAKKGFKVLESEVVFESFQNLHSNEITVEGSADYLGHKTRDAGFEEILHFVQDNGINIAFPDYKKHLENLTQTAISRGFKNWAPDKTESNEYFAVLLDIYLDLWKSYPQIYEGKPYDISEGKTHFSAYSLATNHEDLLKNDPKGFEAIEMFFPKYITYTAYLDKNFEGTFSLVEDETQVYTQKSKYLVNIKLNGNKNSGIEGNDFDNTFYGNLGNNNLDGGNGFDTVVYQNTADKYTIENLGDHQTKITGEGEDILKNIEKIQFLDKEVLLKN